MRKHASADQLTITLANDDSGHDIKVRDDGVGFEPARVLTAGPGHLGVPSMHERAALAGGWCRVTSAPGSGTTVHLFVPNGP